VQTSSIVLAYTVNGVVRGQRDAGIKLSACISCANHTPLAYHQKSTPHNQQFHHLVFFEWTSKTMLFSRLCRVQPPICNQLTDEKLSAPLAPSNLQYQATDSPVLLESKEPRLDPCKYAFALFAEELSHLLGVDYQYATVFGHPSIRKAHYL
jgi:hypothetical protein